MGNAALAALVLLFYLLHQDFWLWRSARPLVFGWLPAGLAYHVAYSIVTVLLMVVLIRRFWPSHLESAHREDSE